MAEYSTAQMEESLAEEEIMPQAAPKSWRRFGMVAAALGTVGAIFGMTRPKSLTTLQKMQHVAHVGHSFMQAVVARALQDDDEGIAVDVGMIFAPVGLDEWSGVSTHLYLRPAEEAGADPHIRVTFKAKDDAGDSLKEQFQNILDGVKEHMKDNEDVPADLFDSIDVSTDADDGDMVHITISPPSPPDFGEEDQKMLEEGMAAKPTLQLAIHTGRTFQEMVDNIHGCVATLDGGINITASTKLAKALIDAMNDMEEEGLSEIMSQMGEHDRHSGPFGEAREAMHRMHALEAAFASFSSKTEIRYDAEKFEAAVCGEESEEQKQQIEFMKTALPYMLAPMVGLETVKTAAGLTDYADHLHSIRLAGGLPEDYEIYMKFENFHLTPVIAQLLQIDEGVEEAAGGEPAEPIAEESAEPA